MKIEDYFREKPKLPNLPKGWKLGFGWYEDDINSKDGQTLRKEDERS